MKKVLAMMMVIMVLVTMGNVAVFAAEDSVQVYVTISDGEGNLVLTQKEVAVTDEDNDGNITIYDALYAAHEANYNGGATAGFAAVPSEFGLSLTKLWGVENGGSYGYYLNNASAMGLTDTVKNGDYLNAYVYTDLTAWSDTYCYFNVNTVSANAGEEITITLSAAGFDANWAPVVVPVADATITINGQETQYKTDAQGTVKVTMEEAGSFVISATSTTQTLVPPVCMVTIVEDEVSDDNTLTGDDENVIFYVIIAAVALVIMVVLFFTRKKSNEN